MKLIYLIFSTVILSSCNEGGNLVKLKTAFELSDGKATATYKEGIKWWKDLEQLSPYVSVQTFGETDAGLPLHLVIVNPRKNFSQEIVCEKDQTIFLINNAIHPGEPDGVDASMLFVRDLLSSNDYAKKYDNTVILIIPFYNVGGALNRNCCSRSNQNGPTEYGFRGNARNLDLNRDFIKCDSKNALSFAKLFTEWDPDVYLETHVSNGADYPYTMTFLASQTDKLGGVLGSYLKDDLTPRLFESMKTKGDEMTPYVNVFGVSPDSGIACFYDSPRYSTGYTALHQSIGMLTETHMLKPYNQRVESTRRFMHSLVDIVNAQSGLILEKRKEARQALAEQTEFPVDWEVDSADITPLSFKGYRAYIDTSNVTGKPQLYYDQTQTWQSDIPYFAALKPTLTITAPSYYLVPKSWNEVVERLKSNGVDMHLIQSDSLMHLTAYEIDKYNTMAQPKEGHYLHYNTRIEKQYWSKQIIAGSYYIVDVNQAAKRFIVEALEPEGPDSYFNWNFYDEILQQKEYFSSYVFDAEAEELLKDSTINKFYHEMIEKDSNFAKDSRTQLYFLYRQSSHYEREHHMIYPVYRIE